MAKFNGSISLNTSHFGCYLNVYESNENKINNTHNVTAELHITRSQWGWQTSNNYSGSIVIDGTTFSFSYSPNWPYSSSGDAIVGRATKTVTHNSNGTKSCGVSATWNTSGTYSCGTASASGTLTLTTIPRASGIACSSPYIGDTATVTIDKKSNDFTNTVSYAIGSISGTLATKTSATVLSLATEDIAEQIYALIPNSKQIQGKIYCSTYSGDTKIGDTTEATFYLYAKESDCKPTVTGTVVDTNATTIALTDDSNVIIKYASKPKVAIQATANKGASITRYVINTNDGQQVNLQEYTFENGIASDTITINAVDTRGFEAPVNLTLSTIDYTPIIISDFYGERPEDVSNEILLSVSGVLFNGKFSANKSNSLTCRFWYRESGQLDWVDGGIITPTIEGNTFEFKDFSLGNIYDYQKQWQFKLRVQDLTGYAERDDLYVSKGKEVLAIGEDKVWVNGDLILNDINISNLSKYMYLTKSTNQTIPVDGAVVVYDTIHDDTSNTSLVSDGTGIIVNDDISLILVSAQFRDASFTNQNNHIYIEKNGEKVSDRNIYGANYYIADIIPVKKDDKIRIFTYSGNQLNIIGKKLEAWDYFKVVILN